MDWYGSNKLIRLHLGKLIQLKLYIFVQLLNILSPACVAKLDKFSHGAVIFNACQYRNAFINQGILNQRIKKVSLWRNLLHSRGE